MRGRKGTLKVPVGQVVSDTLSLIFKIRKKVLPFHFSNLSFFSFLDNLTLFFFFCFCNQSFVLQPLCYGWKYLKALDALIDDEHVDTEYLDQSVSDMLDMKFSQAVSTIIEECGNALLGANTNICPSLEVLNTDLEPSCDDQCQPGGNNDCQFREICCK